MTTNSYFIRSALAVLISAVSVAYAQQKPQLPGDYPNKPIRIITSEPGGGQDFAARIFAQGLLGPLGQPVIVENRTTLIAGEIVAKAPPDGYTVLISGSTLWYASLFEKTPSDPLKDFSPITLIMRSPNVLVVHPSLPVKSVKELIALAKAKPGELNYVGAGLGSQAFLGAELFKSMAGLNIVHIPTKASGTANLVVIRGEGQLTFATASSITPHIKSGRVRALAVTSGKPSALFPGLPTVAETLPGYELGATSGTFVPVGTPPAIISRLNREIVRILNQADTKEKFLSVGADVVGSSPEEFAAAVKTDMARLGKVVKDAGIRAE